MKESTESLPRISVVVPSFNQGAYIEATLRSVLDQGYPDLELIVMDGGSADETVGVLRRFDERLTYWVSEPDAGQTDAINKGLERATGEILCYLNSDDLLAPGSLNAVARAFRQHPDVDVVHGRCVYVSQDGEELFTRAGKVTDLASYLRIWDRFRDGEYLTQPEVFWRKALYDRVGPFRVDLHSVMDFEMWLRMLSAGATFHFIDVPLAVFRTYPTQKSSVDPGDELCRVVSEYAHGSPGLQAGDREPILRELPHARAQLLVRAALAAGLTNRYRTGLRYCARALLSDPAVAFTYGFWAAVLTPVRRRLPAPVRARIRRAVER